MPASSFPSWLTLARPGWRSSDRSLRTPRVPALLLAACWTVALMASRRWMAPSASALWSLISWLNPVEGGQRSEVRAGCGHQLRGRWSSYPSGCSEQRSGPQSCLGSLEGQRW